MPYETYQQKCRRTLVLGVGNTLRRDDGVGHAIVEALRQRDFPDAQVASVHQLTPELADDLSASDVVVFVDATVDAKDLVVATVQPEDTVSSPLDHATEPAGLVAFTRQQYGRAPEAWVVGIPAHDLGHGEGLSDKTLPYLKPAIEAVTRIIVQPCTSSL